MIACNAVPKIIPKVFFGVLDTPYGTKMLPRANLVAYFKVSDGLQDSIGDSDTVITISSGTGPTDWVFVVTGSSSLTGATTFLELQAAADGVYTFVGRHGAVIYNVDMSAYATRILGALGGLYNEPSSEEFTAVNPDDSEMLNPDASSAVNPS